MNSLDYSQAQRCALSVTGMRDLAHALLNPGNATTHDFGTLGEFVARAPHFPADIAPEAVSAARKRLTDARDRGNTSAARVLAELETAR